MEIEKGRVMQKRAQGGLHRLRGVNRSADKQDPPLLEKSRGNYPTPARWDGEVLKSSRALPRPHTFLPASVPPTPHAAHSADHDAANIRVSLHIIITKNSRMFSDRQETAHQSDYKKSNTCAS
jgi:hypothetical protein